MMHSMLGESLLAYHLYLSLRLVGEVEGLPVLAMQLPLLAEVGEVEEE